MSTFRKAHNKENPYAQISREMLQNANMSFAARGLLSYLLSLPGDWEISLKHLTSQSNLKKQGIRTLIKELENNRYIKRGAKRVEKGQFNGWEFTVYEEPYEDSKNVSVMALDRSTVVPIIGKVAPTKEIEYNKINNNINKSEVKKEPEAKASLASEEAHFCSKYLFNKLKERREDRKEPDFKKWALEMDLILRIDKKTQEKVLKVLDWLFGTENKFIVNSPGSLRKKFENICDHMAIPKTQNSLKSSPCIHVSNNWEEEEKKQLEQIKELIK